VGSDVEVNDEQVMVRLLRCVFFFLVIDNERDWRQRWMGGERGLVARGRDGEHGLVVR